MSRVAAWVYAIERYSSLCEAASERLKALGYDNVEIRVGDGTKGWPEVAPFDAIIVSAGGRQVPGALKQQLAIGGRLIIPVGENADQRLMKMTRHTETDFESQDLGRVVFVQLIAEDGKELS